MAGFFDTGERRRRGWNAGDDVPSRLPGDGGSSNDPSDYAQDDTHLLGKMLRLDVVGVAHPAPGYRNPWCWSFDAPTGELWLGDVGQGAREGFIPSVPVRSTAVA